MKFFLSVFIGFSLLASTAAKAGAPQPPTKIDQASFTQWLGQIGATPSAYIPYAFGWLEAQRTSALPAAVAADPDKILVSVDKPLAEAIRLESAGDVEEGTTFGLESYGILDAPVSTVLEAILFCWGKPVGAPDGVTHPIDAVYGFREEKLTREWGDGTYKTYTAKKNGGIAQDENDTYTLLVRGDAKTGYLVAGAFLGPNGADTSTTSYITIMTVRPMADGKTDYRVAGMLTGQNYSFLGLDSGRHNYGFNAVRLREGLKGFLAQVKSLKETGKIPEHP